MYGKGDFKTTLYLGRGAVPVTGEVLAIVLLLLSTGYSPLAKNNILLIGKFHIAFHWPWIMYSRKGISENRDAVVSHGKLKHS